MPYTIDNPPDAIKKLPKHAIEIWVAAYNSAFKQYEGDEGKAAGTAWAAVKMKYKQDKDGNWVAKETKEVAMATKTKVKEVEMSAEDKRRLLQAAVIDQMGYSDDDHIWVEDIWDTELVYCVNQQSYKVSYTIGEDSKVEFGSPEKVRRQTTYEPMESLRSKYSEIIQEVGRRNANADAARIKKIVALCQELLSSEEPDEDKIKKAVKEATSVLDWLKEQAAAKTEDGEKYPATAFAYVPDTEKPSEWKLRLWEDPTLKVTRAQLGRAAAALSPGGFRGQKVDIPREDLPAVKRKIRAEYRKLDVEDEEIPKWVKESTTRMRLRESFPCILSENVTPEMIAKGVIPIRIIQSGFNVGKSHYYSEKAVADAARIFENTKMYIDHPTEREEQERPERSLRDWAATLKNTRVSDKGNAVGDAHIHVGYLKEMVTNLYEQNNLDQLGVSINAIGVATKQKIEDVETAYVESLTRGKSVDFVTEAGAGGQAGLKESAEDDYLDVDLIDLAQLKEARPDLVKQVESAVKAEIKEEVKKAMENEERIKELEGQIETLTTERDGLLEAAKKAEKEKAKAEAQATIKEAVDKAELPDAAKERLIERFKDAETADGIAEAIQAEIDYIAKLSEAGKVKGMGPSKSDSAKDKAALKESFKQLHPDWTDKQLDTAVEGR